MLTGFCNPCFLCCSIVLGRVACRTLLDSGTPHFYQRFHFEEETSLSITVGLTISNPSNWQKLSFHFLSWYPSAPDLSLFTMSPHFNSTLCLMLSFGIISYITIYITPTLATHSQTHSILKCLLFLAKLPCPRLHVLQATFHATLEKFTHANMLKCTNSITLSALSTKWQINITVPQRKTTNAGKFQVDTEQDGILGQWLCFLIFFKSLKCSLTGWKWYTVLHYGPMVYLSYK